MFFLFKKYYSILSRLNALETVTNVLLFDKKWVDDKAKYLNGQERRQELFQILAKEIDFFEIYETGAFIGNTTGYFANLFSNKTIYSCELNLLYFELAKLRLSNFSNIILKNLDSRILLNSINFSYSPTLFYLDAHWYSDLPLKEELSIITSKRPNSLIVVDDFQVPNDPGYNFDNYGKGKILDFKNFGSIFSKLSLYAFYPAANSSSETGYKRGYILLTNSSEIFILLKNLKSLNSYKLN